MVDAICMAGMVLLPLAMAAGLYFYMRLTGRPRRVAAPAGRAPPGAGDEAFVESIAGPAMEDAQGALDMAAEAALAGIGHYRRKAWEAAGGELHAAGKDIGAAAAGFEEIVAMLEDRGSAASRRAGRGLAECRSLGRLAARMEEACDARVAGNPGEAERLEDALPGLESLALSITGRVVRPEES